MLAYSIYNIMILHMDCEILRSSWYLRTKTIIHFTQIQDHKDTIIICRELARGQQNNMLTMCCYSCFGHPLLVVSESQTFGPSSSTGPFIRPTYSYRLDPSRSFSHSWSSDLSLRWWWFSGWIRFMISRICVYRRVVHRPVDGVHANRSRVTIYYRYTHRRRTNCLCIHDIYYYCYYYYFRFVFCSVSLRIIIATARLLCALFSNGTPCELVCIDWTMNYYFIITCRRRCV